MRPRRSRGVGRRRCVGCADAPTTTARAACNAAGSGVGGWRSTCARRAWSPGQRRGRCSNPGGDAIVKMCQGGKPCSTIRICGAGQRLFRQWSSTTFPASTVSGPCSPSVHNSAPEIWPGEVVDLHRCLRSCRAGERTSGVSRGGLEEGAPGRGGPGPGAADLKGMAATQRLALGALTALYRGADMAALRPVASGAVVTDHVGRGAQVAGSGPVGARRSERREPGGAA
jgi:hypothetical protein